MIQKMRLLFCPFVFSVSALAAPVINSISPAQVANGKSVAVTINGSGFNAASEVLVDGAPIATTRVSASQLRATVRPQPSVGGVTGIRVRNSGTDISAPALIRNEAADPKVSYGAAARFLEQAAFGPDPKSIQRVQELGFAGYINEQFADNSSSYGRSSDTNPSLAPAQNKFFTNITKGTDQLRQRMVFALSQLFVVSGYKTASPQQFMPWLQLLNNHAFSNFETLLRAVTLNPAMGRYLDMVNNKKANSYLGSVPNENYAREVLQLFTIGTEMLNPDGTVIRNSDGAAIPAYSAKTVEAFSRVFTGWTYAALPGAPSSMPNPQNFDAPMEAIDSSHDTESKTILRGVTLPAGQTAEKDLNDALQNIFRHPNVGPFLARRLIRNFVTSNPSPAYVERVAEAFNANASGVRGDLRAVLRAILIDPEARAGDSPNEAGPPFGHLREPVLYMAAAVRALGASINPAGNMPGIGSLMDQFVFYPKSVFGYYSSSYTIPGSTLKGPEFQIMSPSTAVGRTNFAYALGFSPGSVSVNVDLSRLEALGGDVDTTIEVMNRAFLRGQMGGAMKNAIRPAMLIYPPTLPLLRAQTALFLTASSMQFQVQR